MSEIVDTEIGLISKEWTLDELGNHLIIKGRIGWKGLKISEYRTHGAFIVGGLQLKNDSVVWENCSRISEERYNESPEIMLKPHDILMTKDGTIGKLAYIKELPEKATVASHIFVIRNNSNKLDQKFLFFYFKSKPFQWIVNSRIEGSVIPALYQRDIVELKVPLPSVSEQKAIASILSSLDSKIDILRRQNQTLENIAQTLFKRWFIEFEFPDEDGKPYKSSGGKMVESELGEIPEGWNVEPLNNHLEIEIGGDWGKEAKEDGLIPVICLRGTDLQDLKESGYSSNAPIRWIKPISLKKRIVKETEILIGGSGLGPIGRTTCVHNNILSLYEMPIIYSNFCKKLKARDKYYAMFFEFTLERLYKTEQMGQYFIGTSIPNLDVKSLMAEIVLIPSDKITTLFGRFLDLKLSKHFSKEKEVLSQIRDTLLPKLMSGQIRVKNL